jgi:hypothetical protein
MSNQEPPKVVRVNQWGFEDPMPGKPRSRVTVAGIFLIVIGVLLGAGQLFPEARIGASAFFLAFGLLLVYIGVRDRRDLALYAGLLVTALALSNLLSGMDRIHGPGWGTLFLGIGVVALALIRSSSGRRWGWTLAIGLLLTLWGGSEVASTNLNFPADRLVVPALMVMVGIYILVKTASRRNR